MIGLRLLVDIINRPIITNTCLPKRSHKSLHRKLVPILLVVYGAANRDILTLKCEYRIYSINRPGRLLNFWTVRVGAYSRLGAY